MLTWSALFQCVSGSNEVQAIEVVVKNVSLGSMPVNEVKEVPATKVAVKEISLPFSLNN